MPGINIYVFVRGNVFAQYFTFIHCRGEPACSPAGIRADTQVRPYVNPGLVICGTRADTQVRPYVNP